MTYPGRQWEKYRADFLAKVVKTTPVQECHTDESGRHSADVMIARIKKMQSELDTLRVENACTSPVGESMEVKICGVPYLVSREKDKFRVDHDGNGARLWGQISYSGHSIRFLQSSPEQELRSVVHEILHGIVENGVIRELMNENGEHLETPINQLANGLAEVLESIGFTLPLAPHTAKNF